MHPNDTLNGRLFAWEREDEKHLRHKFGYWFTVEQRMVQAELEAEGLKPEGVGYFMELARRIEVNHKNDPKPWHDSRGLMYGGAIRQQADAERWEQMELSPEEWAYLAETLADANHPLARSIAQKAAQRK